MEREDLIADPRFDSTPSRGANNTALLRILTEVFLGRTLAEWKERLGTEMPWAPVQSQPEICRDPQARINRAFISYDHPSYGKMDLIANPVNLSETPSAVHLPAPELGQHTEMILLENGLSWEEIAALKEKGVIA
jgi:crotonobetainyl-CoA:carnitine CoA-transferase CaiB-like acyl-CoA transferase